MGEVGELLDIVEQYLGDRVGGPRATSRGSQAQWKCPFHKGGLEHKGSFYLNLDNGKSFCHTCDEGWSLQGLLAKLNVPKRIRDLAQSLVVEDDTSPFKRAPQQEFFLPEALLGVYDYCPSALLDAGFDKELLQAYDVGYDLNLDRVTWPFRDHGGRLVGISGGSSFEGAYPKYKIYDRRDLQLAMPDFWVPKDAPENSFYLWNLDRVWASAFHGAYEGPIVICEGFKAALWVIQSGYPITVAAMGTYLSHWQTMLLRHMANRLVLFFDQDEPGRKATTKAKWWLRKHGALVEEATYPRGDALQPDDLEHNEVQQAIKLRRM